MRTIIRASALVAALGVCAAASAASPEPRAGVQTVAAANSLRLVDSSGRVVGVVLGPTSVGGVFSGTPLLLEMSRASIVDSQSYDLFYISNDCSGQPYGPPDSGGLFRDHVVIGGSIYYVADGAPRAVAYSHQRVDAMGMHACDFLGSFGWTNFYPYTVMKPDFQPPFRIAE